MHFVQFFSFNSVDKNHKEKEFVMKITVVVALDLDIHKDKKCLVCNERTKDKADKTKLYSNIIKQNIDYDNIKYI